MIQRFSMVGRNTAARESFWKRVEIVGECFIWRGKIGDRGYGLHSVPRGHRRQNAHRFSYEIHNGPIPKGMLVCHSCDTPACVNPAHLWLGTTQDNTRDAITKGRMHWQKKSP